RAYEHGHKLGPDIIVFLSRQLKHEVGRKAFPIPRDRLIQGTSLDAIERSEIRIEHHLFATNEEHQLHDILRLERESHCLVRFRPACGGGMKARKISERRKKGRSTN